MWKKAAVPSGCRSPLHRVVAILLAFFFGAAGFAAHAGPQNLKSCEVQPSCKVFVPESNSCSSIVGWVGKCERGHAQGTGALHFLHGTALVGRYTDGRATGEAVWHENGIPKGIGEYETQLLVLGPNGFHQGEVASCYWDFAGHSVVSASKHDKRCESAARSLGSAAFSPEVWRAYARHAIKTQLPVGTMTATARRLP